MRKFKLFGKDFKKVRNRHASERAQEWICNQLGLRELDGPSLWALPSCYEPLPIWQDYEDKLVIWKGLEADPEYEVIPI